MNVIFKLCFFASGDYSNGTLVEMLSGVLIDFGNQSYVNPSSVIDLNKTYEVYTDGYGSPSLGDVQI